MKLAPADGSIVGRTVSQLTRSLMSPHPTRDAVIDYVAAGRCMSPHTHTHTCCADGCKRGSRVEQSNVGGRLTFVACLLTVVCCRRRRSAAAAGDVVSGVVCSSRDPAAGRSSVRAYGRARTSRRGAGTVAMAAAAAAVATARRPARMAAAAARAGERSVANTLAGPRRRRRDRCRLAARRALWRDVAGDWW
ncbi:hypothetical protein R5R35_011019 [Gryllus longicercus]|uniref:Uncharacterized protein n=1 Tax=Gryllus longicercus TaxID=2509291 RepID=A0AAN9V7R8_9ORTH